MDGMESIFPLFCLYTSIVISSCHNCIFQIFQIHSHSTISPSSSSTISSKIVYSYMVSQYYSTTSISNNPFSICCFSTFFIFLFELVFSISSPTILLLRFFSEISICCIPQLALHPPTGASFFFSFPFIVPLAHVFSIGKLIFIELSRLFVNELVLDFYGYSKILNACYRP
jgi:hypothetical protein